MITGKWTLDNFMPFIPTRQRNGVLYLLIQECHVGHQGHSWCVGQQEQGSRVYFTQVGMNILLASSSTIQKIRQLTLFISVYHSFTHSKSNFQTPNHSTSNFQTSNHSQPILLKQPTTLSPTSKRPTKTSTMTEKSTTKTPKANVRPGLQVQKGPRHINVNVNLLLCKECYPQRKLKNNHYRELSIVSLIRLL